MAKYETTESLIDEAREHLAYWQKALRLQEWTIHLELYNATFKEEDGVYFARTFRSNQERDAVIRVNQLFWMDALEKHDLMQARPDLSTLEETVVHEMLHIRIGDWESAWEHVIKNADSSDRADHSFEHEQFLNVMARILVGLRHKQEGSG